MERTQIRKVVEEVFNGVLKANSYKGFMKGKHYSEMDLHDLDQAIAEYFGALQGLSSNSLDDIRDEILYVADWGGDFTEPEYNDNGEKKVFYARDKQPITVKILKDFPEFAEWIDLNYYNKKN